MSKLFSSCCSRLEASLTENMEEDRAIDLVKEQMKPLLEDLSYLETPLAEMAEGKTKQLATDYNDVTLYRSLNGKFSIRLFVWEALVPYPVHDHGSWGVVGCLAGQVEETKYRRQDRAQDENYARLEIFSNRKLNPGAMTKVYPLDRGIHHMTAYGNCTALTLHIYGTPVRKGYIRGFVPERKTTYRIFPPKYGVKVIGLKGLSAIDTPQAPSIIEEVEGEGHPLIKELLPIIRSQTPPSS